MMNETTLYQQSQLVSPEGIISDLVLGYVGLALKRILNPTLGVWGVGANIVNIVVFTKMGASDGVTQNFLILSVSDGLISIAALINSVSYILQHTLYRYARDANVVCQGVYWASLFAVTFPQNISLVTTVVVAVVRCCCVAMPLKVKSILTARRQLVAILCFASTAVCVLTYSFSTSYLVEIEDPRSNMTIAAFVGHDFLTYTLFTSVFFYSGFIIVVVCVIILTISLRRATHFRDKSSGGQNSNHAATDDKPKDRKRELQVVKVVVLVAILFIVCFIPAIFYALLRQYLDGFTSQGRYRNSTLVFLMLNETFLVLNADLNIVIYLFYNSRYRETFRATFFRDVK